MDGPASTLGKRFWRLVAQQHAKLTENLESGKSLRTIQYSDRYIVSPLTAKVLSAVVGHLKASGVIQPETRFEIRTAAVQSDRYPARLFDTWQSDATQKAVLQSLLEAKAGSIREPWWWYLGEPPGVAEERLAELRRLVRP